MNRTIVLCTLAFMWPTLGASGQTVFRATQSGNLPTAAMLAQGDWLFGVSHRFSTPISEGADDLWGLDGPSVVRLGLTYAVRDRLMLGVLRTNRDDNVELNARFRAWASPDGADLPFELAGQGGVAWNTQIFETPGSGATDNEVQAYVQLVANVLVAERLALGVVPTFLRNPRLEDDDPESVFVVGVNGQLYPTEGAFSVFGEWIFGEARPDHTSDSGTFGIELRTRGHFFKILVTNQSELNPTQFLAGTSDAFDADNVRLGFNLTRLLPF